MSILGNKTVGFGNTVPMMAGNGKYGVWNVLEEGFVKNTPYDADPNRVIEIYDDMIMTTSSAAKVRKLRAVEKLTKKSNKAPIVRERSGAKLETATKIWNDRPENATVGDLIKIARKLMPEVSAANFRFLFDKLAGKR